MLEEVGIEFLVVECKVWLDIVVEFNDFQFDAIFFEERLDDFEDLSMRYSRSADFQRFHAGSVLRDSAAARG